MQCAGGECSLQDTPSSSCSIWIVAQWGTTDELLRQPRLTGPHGNRRSWPHLQPRVEDLYPVIHLQVIKHLHRRWVGMGWIVCSSASTCESTASAGWPPGLQQCQPAPRKPQLALSYTLCMLSPTPGSQKKSAGKGGVRARVMRHALVSCATAHRSSRCARHACKPRPVMHTRTCKQQFQRTNKLFTRSPANPPGVSSTDPSRLSAACSMNTRPMSLATARLFTATCLHVQGGSGGLSVGVNQHKMTRDAAGWVEP